MSEEEYAEMMKRRQRKATSSVSTDALPPSQEGRAKRAKYGNRKVEIDGMKFDSRHEADYYFAVLLPLWKAGGLQLLARQVPFDLPGGIKYIADFLTVGCDGAVSVIDAKSEATRKNRVYINKKKQMRAVWHLEIMEV